MDSDTCPHCAADLRGPPIPETHRTSGGRTHYSNVIGIEIPGVYDGVLLWVCPVCEGRWHRFPDTEPLHARAAPHVNAGRSQ